MKEQDFSRVEERLKEGEQNILRKALPFIYYIYYTPSTAPLPTPTAQPQPHRHSLFLSLSSTSLPPRISRTKLTPSKRGAVPTH